MNGQIGFITYALDRAPGGIGRYTRELADSLRRAGVALTTLQAGPVNKADCGAVLPGAGLLPALLSIGQLEIAWVAWKRRLSLLHDPTGTAPLMLAAVPRVVTIHDVIPFIWPKTSTRLDRLIYRYWLPVAVRRVDAIIAVSQQGKADILKHLPVRPESVIVIPEAAGPEYCPLDKREIRPGLRRYGIDGSYILCVGSIESRKNLSRLLDAYARLRSWSQHWALVIAGPRKRASDPVFGAMEQLGVRPYVHFAGFVEEADLPALYNGADLLVYPSLYEGFGLPVLEAMACGTPVVTSSVSSLPEVAGDAAILVDPFDPEAIAQAMRSVLEDPTLAGDLRAKGLARARHFSWERTARETIAVYERLLHKELARADE